MADALGRAGDDVGLPRERTVSKYARHDPASCEPRMIAAVVGDHKLRA
jgi:hypothetical protein